VIWIISFLGRSRRCRIACRSRTSLWLFPALLCRTTKCFYSSRQQHPGLKATINLQPWCFRANEAVRLLPDAFRKSVSTLSAVGSNIHYRFGRYSGAKFCWGTSLREASKGISHWLCKEKWFLSFYRRIFIDWEWW